ncbi:hypothetical protein [Streptomyces chumphonensis]|uniref:hypothetical protein n=1 Tax=Streptomyces chumphonensis TaxID=1214925 RepID=UPI003D74705A
MAPKLLEMTRRQGWALDGDLVAKLTEPGGQIRNHGQILRLRIEDLPRRAPQPAAKPTAPLPPWCGECADSNPAARLSGHLRKTYDEHGNAAPCPRCHPSHATNAA